VRVIWLDVASGTDELKSLAADIENGCRAAGIPAEDRPFRAHLTLARAAGRSGSPLPDGLPDPPRLQPWRAEEFVLYESRLGRGPAIYAPIERFALGLSW
jgi:RNA 2',3'-cyclic 3'-phosphodiesterase